MTKNLVARTSFTSRPLAQCRKHRAFGWGGFLRVIIIYIYFCLVPEQLELAVYSLTSVQWAFWPKVESSFCALALFFLKENFCCPFFFLPTPCLLCLFYKESLRYWLFANVFFIFCICFEFSTLIYSPISLIIPKKSSKINYIRKIF